MTHDCDLTECRVGTGAVTFSNREGDKCGTVSKWRLGWWIKSQFTDSGTIQRREGMNLLLKNNPLLIIIWFGPSPWTNTIMQYTPPLFLNVYIYWLLFLTNDFLVLHLLERLDYRLKNKKSMKLQDNVMWAKLPVWPPPKMWAASVLHTNRWTHRQWVNSAYQWRAQLSASSLQELRSNHHIWMASNPRVLLKICNWSWMVANWLLPQEGFIMSCTIKCVGILTSMGGVYVTNEPSGTVARATQ